jgi:hypothetical protein
MFAFSLPLGPGKVLTAPQWPGLSPAMQTTVFVLLAVVPLALMLWLYRYELKLVSRLTAGTLLGLRLVVLALIWFLVCLRPTYAHDHTDHLQGRILVFVDRSNSMNVTDPQREPADKLRLARTLNLGNVDNAVLERWIVDYEAKRPLRWVLPDEFKDDGAKRQKLERERRQAHDALFQEVDKLTRTEIARRLLGDRNIGLLPALAGKNQVELGSFARYLGEFKPDELKELFASAPAAPQKDGKKKAASASPGAFTDLYLPLARALERSGQGKGKVLGVVVLTDGQHNAITGNTAGWREALGQKARDLRTEHVPIFPIALGAHGAPPDVAVLEVKAPAAVFKDVEVAVEVRFKVTGLDPQDLHVELHRLGEKNKLLAERTIHHQPARGKDHSYTEVFPITMDVAGAQTLVATVKPVNKKTKEMYASNNSRSTTVTVTDDRARVLIVDGEARWEYHYLASALQRDRTVELTRVVFEQPRVNEDRSQEELQEMGSPRQQLPPVPPSNDPKASAPDPLADYDCIILGDVNENQLSLKERKRLERYVADRGGTLVVLAGKRSMPLGFPALDPQGGPRAQDPLRKMLPIEQPEVFAPQEGFHLTLTQEGKETKFLDIDPELGKAQERWAQMAPHYWAVVGKAKKEATPLAYLPRPGDDRPLSERERDRALIVRQNYGFGRVLFVGLDSTWRWRYKVGDVYHHRFWGQAIRWAASDKPLPVGNNFVRFGTPQRVYREGDKVEIVSRLSQRFGPVGKDLKVVARILPQDEAGKKGKPVAELELTPRKAQPRVLEGQIASLAAGNYAIELDIPGRADVLRPEAGKGIESLQAQLSVQEPDSKEMIDLEPNWELLKNLAFESQKEKGKVETVKDARWYTAENAGNLIDKLVNDSVPRTHHFEQHLWQWWVLLALVVVLLSLEWVGRKLAGLP